MKPEEFASQVVDPIMNDCKRILTDRGASYSHGEDFISNFKETAKIMTDHGYGFNGGPITAECVAHIFTIFKVQRWGNRMKVGSNRLDETIDGINYMLLGRGCYLDSLKDPNHSERS